MADLVRVATGVDLVEVQIRMALGEELPDELVLPQFHQPLAIRFFTAEPGPLPTGPREADRPARQGARVSRRRAGGRVPAARRDDPARARRRRPPRLRDRHRGHEPRGARARRGRGDACSTWRSNDLRLLPRALPRAAAGGAARRLPVRRLRPRARAGRPVILRHDVDLSLDGALAVAEVEAEEGAWSTWFLMTRSVFYNLASSEGEAAIARLRELGHRVAHHAVWPDVDLDDRFDAVVAWHNPDPEYMQARVARRGQRDGAAVLRPGALPLGLEPALAPRLPARRARARGVRVAAAADAPGDLGLRRARRCGRRWSRCSTPTARRASSTCARDRIDLS